MPGPAKQYEKRVELRIDEALLSKLDVWMHEQNHVKRGWWPLLTRSEAIRLAIKRLVDG